MANVIASYAFTMRYFNGEIEPVETATYMLDICTNLNNNNNFEDPDLAIESVAQGCLQVSKIITVLCRIPLYLIELFKYPKMTHAIKKNSKLIVLPCLIVSFVNVRHG